MFWVSTNHVPWADVRRRLHNVNVTLIKKHLIHCNLSTQLGLTAYLPTASNFLKFTSSFHYFLMLRQALRKVGSVCETIFKVLNDRAAQDRKNCTQGSNFDSTCATVLCQQKAPYSTKGQAPSIKFVQRSSWSWRKIATVKFLKK